MTVPTYSRITDPEIAPEAALTTSLFHKLRDNCLALLGADGASSSPTIVTPGNRNWVKLSAGTYSFTVPTATSIISYDGWGPGGRVTSDAAGPGGKAAGGAGQYREGMLDVTPLETLTVIIGAEGSEASTYIKRGSTVLVEIKAGRNAPNGSTAGAGGTGGSSTPAASYPDADVYIDGRAARVSGKYLLSVAAFSSEAGPGTGAGNSEANIDAVNASDGGVRISY